MEKKKKKGILYLFTLSVLLLFSVSTSCKDEETEPIPVQKIEFSTSTLTLNIGETAKVEATIYPFDATEKRLQWSSSNTKIADVDSEGNINAYSDGVATITAIPFDGDCYANCKVTVLPNIVQIEKITLSNESITMSVNDEFTLTADIYPSDATNKNLLWKSSNTSVATVRDGVVKAIKEGNAIITATTEDGKHSSSCSVLVTNAELSWGICGTFNNWGESGEDIPMLDNLYDNYYVTKNVNLKSYEVDAFAFRYGNSWELHKGADEKYEKFSIGTKYSTATYDDGVCPIYVMTQGTYDIFLAKTLDYFYIMPVGEIPPVGETPKDEFDLAPTGKMDGYEYVDLGLSVKWATHNIGANDIEGFGEYYAWGEITPYNFELTYINYGWSFAPCSPDAILASIYDTATKNWGSSWRMPTSNEMKELINGCNWTWVNNFSNTSTSGYVATSKKNGKSIFLPATKFMSSTSYQPKEKDAIYWTSSTHTVAGKLNFQAGSTAECLRFVTTEGMVAPVEMDTWAMGNGATIRPVIGTPNDYFPDPEDLTVDYTETQRQGISVSGGIDGYTYVDLGMPSRTLWATYNVGATMPTEYGDYFAWGETKPKEYYIDETYVFFKGFSDGKNPRTQLSKYVWEKEYGTPDAKFKLDNEDDAAYVNWSSNWCMPTVEQVLELAEYCDFWRKDIVVNGKKIVGYMGESKLNGNRIYFPAAGWEYSSVPNTFLSMNYWTSEISRKISTWASLMQYREVTGLLECHDGTARWEGLSVRPVVKK